MPICVMFYTIRLLKTKTIIFKCQLNVHIHNCDRGTLFKTSNHSTFHISFWKHWIDDIYATKTFVIQTLIGHLVQY